MMNLTLLLICCIQGNLLVVMVLVAQVAVGHFRVHKSSDKLVGQVDCGGRRVCGSILACSILVPAAISKWRSSILVGRVI